MENFKILNSTQLTNFENRLDSYWIDFNSSHFTTEEISQYYKLDDNIPLIDTIRNNYKALALAIHHSDDEFIEFMLKSPKIKNKEYSLNDISQTIIQNKHFLSNKAIKLIIDCFENQKEIFKDYRLKTKKMFIERAIEYFVDSNFLDKKFGFKENSDYFFFFMKKYKINPYDDKHKIIASLLERESLEALDLLIEKAKKKEDKEKILFFDLTDLSVSKETIKYLDLKQKEYNILQNYNKLKEEINPSEIKSKRIKI